MENFKFILFSIIVLALVGLLGYWAIFSIQSGPEHRANQKIEQLEKENEELKKEVEDLTDELAIYKPQEEPVLNEGEGSVEPETPKPEPEKIVYEHQDLINELQKMIDENVLMRLKSKGTRVGTVQKFLNIYNNTSNRVDNDYGEGMKKAVIAFQKAEGLTADGEAGPSTFLKMIEWLKEN